MTDTFGNMDAGRGEACSNLHPPNTFTCPGCYKDHERSIDEGAAFLRCECGAPLRLEVELVPNYVATIADADEEEENLGA